MAFLLERHTVRTRSRNAQDVHMESMGNPGTIAVLLVDDQRFVSLALERLLATEQDIELHWCGQASDAIALANHLHPAIILQDLVLPDIDGLGMMRLFRANPLTADTPVIILSVSEDAETRTRALAEGADDYLVMLPGKADLINCIRRHAIRAAAVNACAETAPVANARDTSSDPAEETFDRRVLEVFLEAGGPESSDFTLMLIDQFIAEAGSQVDKLRDAQLRQDAKVLKAIAHSLKGSAMTMGARRLAALCAQTEVQSALNPGGDDCAQLMAEVDREFVKVRHALTAERRGLQS